MYYVSFHCITSPHLTSPHLIVPPPQRSRHRISSGRKITSGTSRLPSSGTQRRRSLGPCGMSPSATRSGRPPSPGCSRDGPRGGCPARRTPGSSRWGRDWTTTTTRPRVAQGREAGEEEEVELRWTTRWASPLSSMTPTRIPTRTERAGGAGPPSMATRSSSWPLLRLTTMSPQSRGRLLPARGGVRWGRGPHRAGGEGGGRSPVGSAVLR